jgi:hypothetical protein
MWLAARTRSLALVFSLYHLGGENTKLSVRTTEPIAPL